MALRVKVSERSSEPEVHAYLEQYRGNVAPVGEKNIVLGVELYWTRSRAGIYLPMTR